MSFTATHFGSDADRLVRLLRQRPELDSPPIRSVIDLEYRLTRTPGFRAGLARIDVIEWTVLQAAMLAPPDATFVDLAQIIGTPVFADDVAAAAARLESFGLAVVVNGSIQTDPMLRPCIGYPAALGPTVAELVPGLTVGALRAILGRYGAQVLGPKPALVAALCAVLQDDDQLAKAYEALPERAHDLLVTMTYQTPVLQVEDPWWQPTEKPVSATGHLRAWGLGLPTQQYRIALPREVSLRRRGGRYFSLPRRSEPAVRLDDAQNATSVAREAVGVVARLFGDLDRLLAVVAAEPVQALQSGGIGTSQLKRLGKLLGMEATRVADLLDVLAIVGLVCIVEPPTRGRSKPPTSVYGAVENYRKWSEVDLARRWCDVVQSWYFSRLFLGLGGRAEGDRTPEPTLKWTLGEPVVAVRAGMVDMLACGFVTTSAAAVAEWCAWHRPLAGSGEYDPVHLMTREAEFLRLIGVVGAERSFPVAASVLQRIVGDHNFSPLTAADDDEVLQAVSAWLTDASSVMKVQGDMTIVVTGQPSAALSAELALIADVVSRGAATVYRLTESSMHRAFESGRTAAHIISLLADESAASLPSSVGTLVEDAERRFGRVRVAKASSVVVVADVIAAAELANSRNAKVRALHLTKVAPTVFVSDAAHTKVLLGLKDAGIAASALIDTTDAGGSEVGTGNGGTAGSVSWQPAARWYQFRRSSGEAQREPVAAAEAILRPAPTPTRPTLPSQFADEADDFPDVGDQVQILHFAGTKPKVDFGTVIALTEYELVLLRPNGTQLTLDREDVLSWAYDDDFDDD